MNAIRKADIVGARIVAISYTYQVTESGLDERPIYFTVDRGFSFLMPFVGAQWQTTEIPEGAKPFVPPGGWLARILKSPERKILEQIGKSAIAGVFGDPTRPDETVILLDDGSRISNTMVAPHGTGAAGLYYFSRFEKGSSLDQMKDLFDLPLDLT